MRVVVDVCIVKVCGVVDASVVGSIWVIVTVDIAYDCIVIVNDLVVVYVCIFDVYITVYM